MRGHTKFLDNKGWSKYIDVESWADRLILFELALNNDGLLTSSFIHKKAGQKISAGPLWDMNYAFGLLDTNNGIWIHCNEVKQFANKFGIQERANMRNWYTKLTNDARFGQVVHN